MRKKFNVDTSFVGAVSGKRYYVRAGGVVDIDDGDYVEAAEKDLYKYQSVYALAEHGISGSVISTLVDNGMSNVNEVIGYGDLTAIDGIGDATAEKVAKAISELRRESK